jgi:Flp pilus assembly protein RcpC/CpaB
VRRSPLAAGFDLATAGLIVGGAILLAASVVAAMVLLAPPRSPTVPVAAPSPAPTPGARAAAALPADRVATVLTLDAAAGAAAATRSGDHIDIFGYFARRTTGSEAVTRVLLADVPVLGIDRAGNNVSLTLAVPPESALVLQEAQALGVQPFVALRPVQPTAEAPADFSDTDLVNRLTAGAQ